MRIVVGLGVGVLCTIVLAGCDNPLNPVGPTQIGMKADRQPGTPPTRVVPVVLPKPPKASITGSYELFTQPGPEEGQVFYTFIPRLTESAGVSATVTSVEIFLDDGWAGWCEWKTGQMVHTRLLANDTLTLDTLTCQGWFASEGHVWVNLTDDNGYSTSVYFYRWLALPETRN